MAGDQSTEIERKYLVTALPDLAGVPSSVLDQGYLALDGPVEVRVRRDGVAHVLTVKGGGGRERTEVELELSAERFAALWPLTQGRRVEKTRHRLPAGELLIELDVYRGALAGLAVAEVEFPSRAAAEAFSPPSWFGREVTDDRRYRNAALALHGRPRDAVGEA